MVGSMAVLFWAVTFLQPGILLSAASLSGLVVFSWTFVTGLGPIPNIICGASVDATHFAQLHLFFASLFRLTSSKINKTTAFLESLQ